MSPWVRGSTVRTSNGPALYTYAGYLRAFDDDLITTGTSTAAVEAAGGGVIRFGGDGPGPNDYAGLSHFRAGGLGLHARAYGYLNAGDIDPGLSNYNHFCDTGASTIKVETGGYIYAAYNYWQSGTPIITGDPSYSSYVYVDYDLGTPDCSGTPYAALREPLDAPNAVNTGPSDLGEAVGLAVSRTGTLVNPARELLQQAHEELKVGRRAEAAGLLGRVTREHASSGEAVAAALELGQIFYEHGEPAVEQSLKTSRRSEANTLVEAATVALARGLAGRGRRAEALGLLGGLGSGISPNSAASEAASVLGVLVRLDEGDVTGARRALTEAVAREVGGRIAEALERMVTEAELAREVKRAKAETSTPLVSLNSRQDTPRVNSGLEASVYPNPVREAVSVSFLIDVTMPVRVEVFDAVGRRVSVLLNEERGPGTHTVAFVTNDMPAGLYLWRVTTGTAVRSGTFVLVR